MKIGITGATGQLGNLVVAKLKEKTAAENLVALVRTPEKAGNLGIEARMFDYNQPSGLSEALKGIDILFLISGSEIGKRAEQHQNVINAAKEAGIKRIVYTSLLHADRSTLVLAPEHLATETAIKASGLTYTILRNGWYTENYTASIPAALQAGTFTGSAGDGKIASASRSDFADAAVAVLTGPGHDGKIYELAGDEYYTLTDFAAVLSEITGKNIPYQNLQEADYTSALIQAGLPEPLAAAFASFDASAAKGDLYDSGKQLSQLTGHSTMTLADAIKKALAGYK